jgi:hypothetical protein
VSHFSCQGEMTHEFPFSGGDVYKSYRYDVHVSILQKDDPKLHCLITKCTTCFLLFRLEAVHISRL